MMMERRGVRKGMRDKKTKCTCQIFNDRCIDLSRDVCGASDLLHRVQQILCKAGGGRQECFEQRLSHATAHKRRGRVFNCK